jgi:hypothetical protein
MLKFVVGLTDVADYEGFIYNESTTNNDPGVYYNIRKASVEIEKATLEWKINTDIDAAKNSVMLWEKIIRIPHLCMIGFHTHPYKFYPEFNEYNFSISFVNLLPVNLDFIKKFTNSDYNKCNGEPDFGDLCINMFENINGLVAHDANIIGAFSANDISVLPDASVKGDVLPRYFANFPLRGNSKPQRWINQANFAKFIDDNKEIIVSKGYDISSPRIENYGPITVGKLLTEPTEAYESLSKYPRICRTSFVQTEE